MNKGVWDKMAIRMFFLMLLFGFLIQYGSAIGQGQNHLQNIQPIKTTETKSSEQFVYPFNVSNADRRNPVNYTFNAPIGENWILTIQNNMSYALRDDAKTIIRLHQQLLEALDAIKASPIESQKTQNNSGKGKEVSAAYIPSELKSG